MANAKLARRMYAAGIEGQKFQYVAGEVTAAFEEYVLEL